MAALATPVRHQVETSSTSADARAAFERGEVEGPVWFTTARQTAGIGRRGRDWHHHPGNFAGTLLWPVAQDQLKTAPLFSFVAALSVAEAVDDTGLEPALTKVKWPNDVLIDGQKLAGILCELMTMGERWAILIGIGVNLLSAPEDEAALALSDCLGAVPPMPSAFRNLIDDRFRAHMELYEKAGFLPIRAAWLARAAGLGGPITVRHHDSVREGRFEGIDEDGTLLLGTKDGSERVTAADIFLGPKGG